MISSAPVPGTGTRIKTTDCAVVAGGEGLGHLRADVEQPRQLQRPAPEHRLEGLALDVLHHDGIRAFGRFDGVDDDSVGVYPEAKAPGLGLSAPPLSSLAGARPGHPADRPSCHT